MGFSLTSISEMLKCYDDCEQLDNYLRVHQAELLVLYKETAHKLQLLEIVRELLRKDNNMNYDITLKTLPERYVASVRMIIPCYEQEGELWKIMCTETDHMNIVNDIPCYCSVTYHDGEYKESDIGMEAQKTVKGQYSDTEYVRFKMVSSVTFASATY